MTKSACARSKFIRFGLLGMLAASALLGLSGCGFTPLYAQNDITKAYSQIALETPDTRSGYYVRQALLNHFSETGPKTYRLKIEINERRYDVGLSANGTATRFELSHQVSYDLYQGQDPKPIYHQSFVNALTYDSTENAYSGIAAQQDAENRAATAISDHIDNDLALFFHDKTVKPAL